MHVHAQTDLSARSFLSFVLLAPCVSYRVHIVEVLIDNVVFCFSRNGSPTRRPLIILHGLSLRDGTGALQSALFSLYNHIVLSMRAWTRALKGRDVLFVVAAKERSGIGEMEICCTMDGRKQSIHSGWLKDTKELFFFPQLWNLDLSRETTYLGPVANRRLFALRNSNQVDAVAVKVLVCSSKAIYEGSKVLSKNPKAERRGEDLTICELA